MSASARFHEPSVGESDEWYTPRSIFTALGLKFDLDVASPGRDKCFVPAKTAYTAAEDGLKQPWHGLVWCNPPFGSRYGHVPWLQKFFWHGNGVAIARQYLSSSWWHDVVSPNAETITFPRGKTCFVRPDGSVGTAPGHGVALLGMGRTANTALEQACKGGWGMFVRLRGDGQLS